MGARYALTVGELSRLTGEPLETIQEELRAVGLERVTHNSLAPPAAVHELFAQRGIDYSFRVLAIVNLRGGIGKTTAATTIASRAAQYGFRTCILDLDAQASASLAFDKVPDEDEPIFYDVWQKPAEMVLPSLKKIDDFLHILPSALENGLLDVSLLNPASQKNAVRGVCGELENQGFDLVVIDCPPSLGAAVISTICAAQILVVPLWSDTFSFKGLDLTRQEVASICETFNCEAPVIRLLYSRHDRREKLSAIALERLRSEYSDEFLPTVIPTSTELSKALAKRETIFASRRSSPARVAYDELVRTLLGLELAIGGTADGQG